MRRKSFVAVFVFLLVVLGLVYLWYTTTSKANTATVLVGESLDLRRVVIQTGFYSINSTTDEDLLKKGLEQAVFDGVSKYSFETICGENDFLIFYDQQYYTIIRHFIPNDFYDGIPSPHHYHFSIDKSEDDMYVILKVVGQDPMTIRKKLMPVFMSKSLLWASPIVIESL
ncbi:hypothetical protein [Flavobacterium sp. HSC-61S13]|uniref:hypothetical protein n=1 Tax=Flavobacterium sp. HSC-61S13 TaxID=2910963 RepID=UPI00209C8373|nr:hypothetical protein [Flavobacterium sp. HSC-61S13]MCP1996835.1 methenyltetrahydromethanopterin cyclohydrolase [Flavobacterium sp. HSC-61S13]